MNRMTSPYLPGWEYIADGEPHVFGDRLYIIGSHDRFNGKRFCMNDYVGWSAPLSDLADWRYEGVTYRKTQDPDNLDGKCEMWAPDVCQGPDGRFYLYYCLANKPKIGVAVCDTPAGQYEFYGYVKDSNGNILGQRPGDTRPFDPAVLVDDDGCIHLYAGQSPLNLQMAKRSGTTHKFTYHMELERDMLTICSELTPVIPNVENSAGTGFEGHEFFEASSIRKFGGRYYFIYSSVQCHELCWAVSDRPDGGFRFGGTLVSNGDIGMEGQAKMTFNSKANPNVKNYIGNNHGSVEKVGENYFVFFHRQTNRNMFSRQACVTKIEMLTDGSFRQAEMRSAGMGDTFPGVGEYPARIACQLYSKNGALFSAHPMIQNKKHPAFTQDEPDGKNARQYIANMKSGATAGFKYFDLDNPRSITICVRGKCKGSVLVKTGERELTRIPVSPCKEWTTFFAACKPCVGENALYFTYEGKGYVDFMSFTLEG